ncbi:SAMP protein, partial [Amia calva]|nr:SAMP protein [Amia calva]
MVAGDKPVTEWNHLCATWESASGQAQVWVNSVGSMWKGISRGGSVGPLPSVVLGQDQDNYGGGFNIDDSFQGQISDVHLWDHVLQPCQIHGISQGFPYLQGNVLNWRAMSYSVGGYVIVGQKLDLRPHSSCAAEKQWAREAVNTTETSMSNEI